jgi:transketolase
MTEGAACDVMHDNRLAFAEQLTEIAARDERVVAVCNDSVGSSNLGGFRARFPERLINVGIAEQNMVGVGAGLANAGLIPFVCGASPFLTGRALEQVKADVAYSQLPVILCGMSPGVAYGELGPTHHSPEDLSWLRALPGLDIVIPADRAQTRAAVRQAAARPRPTFIRVGRIKVPDLPIATEETAELERGRFQALRDGTDVTIIAAGTTVARALDAADRLAGDGVSARVLNAVYLAPLDTAAILAAANDTSAIVTAEEANVAGGLGAAVAAVILQGGAGQRVPLEMLGFRDFAPTGDASFLLERGGLTAEGIARAALRALRR